MSVTSIIPIGTRDGDFGLMDFSRKFTVGYKVVTSDPADDVPVIYAALVSDGIDLGIPHAVDTGALCSHITIRQSDSEPQNLWNVSVTYDSTANPNQYQSPLDRPVKIKITFAKGKEAVVADLNGDAVLNSAFDPYLPPLEIDKPEARFSMEKNYSAGTFTFIQIFQYQNTVNDGTWKGFPDSSVKLDGVEYSNEQFDNGISYDHYVWNFSVNLKKIVDGSGAVTWEGGWRPTKIQDQGYFYVDGLGNKKPILDNGGHPKSTVSLLDGLGGQLAPGGTPVMLDYICYSKQDFGVFNL